MKKMLAIPLAMSLIFAKHASAADEVHWTVTGPNSVTVNWHGTNAEKLISYSQQGGAAVNVNARQPSPLPYAAQGTFWEAKLTGLKANTQYSYKIGNNPARTFKTPPALGSANFSIYAQGTIGDSGHFPAVREIQNLIASGKPNLVVGLGDLTLGSWVGQNAVHQHFNDVMAWSQNAAYMPVWGDLDTTNNTKDQFKNYKGRFSLPNSQTSPGATLAGGEDWYWFDYGNTRFITLPEPSQGAWADWKAKAGTLMAQAQSNAKIKFIVTFAHRPAYSSGHFAGSPALKGMLDSLGDSYSKYVLNVNSHSSDYERSKPQHGVVHVTAGVGGRNLMQDGQCLWLTCAKPDWSAYRAMHLGALKLAFTDNDIKGSFICGPAGGGKNDVQCAKGSVIDQFAIGVRAVTPNISSSLSSQPGSATAAPVAMAATASASCSKVNLDLSKVRADGGYAYYITKSFGGTPDDRSLWTNSTVKSTLRLFENGLEIGPAHSGHADIRNSGNGRFSHWSDSRGVEILYFSASNNSNPGSNGRSYSYCFGSGASTPPAPSGDTQAPSAPTGMTATAASSSQINLDWAEPNSNEGVTGYRIYRNGTLLTTTSGTSYQAGGLSASTSYSFYVTAYDAAGNNSGKSTTVSATTSASVSSAPAPTACATDPTSSLVVNVQDKGARGNGSSNDTAAIQAAIDQVAGSGGTVYVPNGTYMIDAGKRLFLKSRLTFRMASGAVLKAIPNSLANYNILRALNVSNVNIIGGTVEGDAPSHPNTDPYGHGIAILQSNGVTVENVTIKNAWGDGIFVSQNSSNIAACSVTADSNKRHGFTVTYADGVVVKNSVFKNGTRASNSSGFQVEPDPGERANNIKLLNSQIYNNIGGGISAGGWAGPVTNLVIDGNTVRDNGIIGGPENYSGIILSRQDGAKVTNNIVKNNVQDGISAYNGTKNSIISGNTVSGSGIGNNVNRNIGNGILVWDSGSTGNTITGNTLFNNKVDIMVMSGVKSSTTISSNNIQ